MTPLDGPFAFYDRVVDAGIPCMVVGSVGAIAYGEPRATVDIDLVLALRVEDIDALIAAFPGPRFYLPHREAIEAELRKRSGHLKAIEIDTGLKADLYPLGDDPLQEYGLENASSVPIAGRLVTVAPPTYLVAMKLRWYAMSRQEKHLRDIRSMLRLSGPLIDRAIVDRWSTASRTDDAWRDCQARAGEE